MFSSRKLPTLVTASLLSLGLGAAAARAEGPAQRGQISVSGPSVRAVVAGPVAIHAYSGFSGGSVYAAPAETGTDADCKAQPLGAPTPVRSVSIWAVAPSNSPATRRGITQSRIAGDAN